MVGGDSKGVAFWQAAMAELRAQRDAAQERACLLAGELAEVRRAFGELEASLLSEAASEPEDGGGAP